MAKAVGSYIEIGHGSSQQHVRIEEAQSWYEAQMKQMAAWSNDNPFKRNLAELREFLDKKPDQRPAWVETFLKMAMILSERSTCLRLHTAAIVTGADNGLLAACYNGAPRGVRHCSEIGCIIHNDHCVRAIHAEQNAILNAIVVKPDAKGLKLYCTHRPCIVCSRLILQYNFTEVDYLNDYDSDGMRDIVISLMREKQVGFRQFNGDLRWERLAPRGTSPTDGSELTSVGRGFDPAGHLVVGDQAGDRP